MSTLTFMIRLRGTHYFGKLYIQCLLINLSTENLSSPGPAAKTTETPILSQPKPIVELVLFVIHTDLPSLQRRCIRNRVSDSIAKLHDPHVCSLVPQTRGPFKKTNLGKLGSRTLSSATGIVGRAVGAVSHEALDCW